MQRKPNQDLRGLPGTKGFPIVGDILKMLPDPLPYLKTLHEQYGNVFYMHFALNRKSVLLLGPDATEQVLVSQADMFSNEWGYLDLSPLLGKRGLLFQDGSAHRILRRSINPAFKPDSLRQHVSIVKTEVDHQLAKWLSGSSTIGADIQLMTLRIASQTIIGANVGTEAATINKNFLDVLGAIVSLLPKFPGTPKWQGHRARVQIDQFFRSRIMQRRVRPGNDVFS
ncbi:MAG: cytochrome P450 [Gammaproteobacteria bacterium]|nr:cytochrome P450 [Gammaproteobacteria bacterium]